MKISPARIAVFQILLKIEKEKSYSSILLQHFEKNLSDKDSSLCHEITLGVLRNKILLDRIIQTFTKKDLTKFDIEVLIAMRMGLYQIIFLDKIPAYSAINESVNLIKFAKKKSAGGLVNAVLRKVSREKFQLEYSDELEKLSIETSHPKWLIEKWIKQFGFDDTKKLAISNNQTPIPSFRWTINFYRKSKAEKQEITDKLLTNNSTKQNEYLDCAFTSKSFNKYIKYLADENLIYFQDIGSQIIAEAIELENGERFLDLCASPGSKTTLIASNGFRKNQTNHLYAGDFYRHRINNLMINCQNQSADFVNIVRYDAEQPLPFKEESFHTILIDAPCTGTGTIRHNPEIRYNLVEKSFSELQHKQLRIIANASKLIKSGGKIIYSTCSLEIEENELVVEKFLSENSDFQKVVPNLPSHFLTEENFGRTFPFRDNTDGFFVAELQKK